MTSNVDSPESERVAAAVPPGRKKSHHNREIMLNLAYGFLFTFLLMGIKLAAERTVLVQQIQVAGYNWLLSWLQASGGGPTVVDISGLPPKPLENRSIPSYTDRSVLISLIRAVAEERPAAIGVDIDFGTDRKGGWITHGDPEFFGECLRIKRELKVPVYLGIYRTMLSSPATWLGDEEFQELAAGMAVPTDKVGRMWKWTEPVVGEAAEEGESRIRRLPTLSGALSRHDQESWVDTTSWLNWAVEHVSERVVEETRVGEYVVDYSPLDHIREGKINTWKAEDIPRNRERLQNRIVLMGKGTWNEACDKFVVPGRTDAIPGIFLHACGAWTLAGSEIYQLTDIGRIVLDCVLAIGVIVAIAAIRLYVHKKTGMPTGSEKLQPILTLAAAIVAFAGGLLFLWLTRVVWDDYIVAIVVLLAHPLFEKKAKAAFVAIRKDFPKELEKLALSAPTEDDHD